MRVIRQGTHIARLVPAAPNAPAPRRPASIAGPPTTVPHRPNQRPDAIGGAARFERYAEELGPWREQRWFVPAVAWGLVYSAAALGGLWLAIGGGG
jgi:hypothetical protein